MDGDPCVTRLPRLPAVGGQSFSAAVLACSHLMAGVDIATFLILGLAAGSFFAYRIVRTWWPNRVWPGR